MTQTNTNQQAIAGVKNVMMVTIARIENAQTLMWITTKVKWSFISYVKMGLNGKKYGHTKGASGLIDTDKYEGHDEDYIEGVKKGILMGYCLGCSLAYPLEDMNKQGLCEECQGGEEE